MNTKMTDPCYLSIQDWENLYDEWETWVFENYTVHNDSFGRCGGQPDYRCHNDMRDGCQCDACLNTEGLLTTGRWAAGKHKGKTPKELNRRKWKFILHAVETYGTPNPVTTAQQWLAGQAPKESPGRSAQQKEQLENFFTLAPVGSPPPISG